jgi:PAS domain S-box-containing protein
MTRTAPSGFSERMTDEIAMQVLARSPFSLVLSDPHQPDMPIVFINEAFTAATGYAEEDCLGKNCRFLQGPKTDQAAVRKIRTALEAGLETTVDILNYRKDGAPFWNRLLLAPVHGPDGGIEFFSGVQKVLTPEEVRKSDGLRVSELQHRVKNHLSMVVSLLRMHGRGADKAVSDSLATVSRRVNGLALLYDQLTYRDGEHEDAVVLGDYLGRIADSISELTGRTDLALKLTADRFIVPLATAVPLGLIYSEIVTNAMQHAFEESTSGSLTTTVAEQPDGGFVITVADDGRGMPAGTHWPQDSNLGGTLVLQMCQTLNADLEVTGAARGTTVTITLPAAAREMH